MRVNFLAALSQPFYNLLGIHFTLSALTSVLLLIASLWLSAFTMLAFSSLTEANLN